LSAALGLALGWLFGSSVYADISDTMRILGISAGVAIGLSLFWFAKLFASESEEQRKVVEEFFKKLDTPIDVAREVFGKGVKQVSTFPLVGGTTIVMGLLMCLIFLTDIPSGGNIVVGGIIALMVVAGAAMWYFGRKSEIRTAEQYMEKISSH
jgi:hypothetical protein